MSVEVKIGSSLFFADGSTTVTLGSTWAGDTTRSTDILSKVASLVRVPGSSYDGMDHDYDQIVVLLNPQVDATIDPLQPTNASWTPHVKTGEPADVVYLYVGNLKERWQFSDSEAARLAHANIQRADYPAILSHDPFALGSTVIDPARFAPTPYTFNYHRVPTCADNGNAATQSIVLDSSSINLEARTYSESYTVGLQTDGSLNAGAIKNTLRFADSFTWTNSRTTKASDGTISSSRMQFGQPNCDYQGPTAGRVYFDTIFRTYLFSLEAY